MSPDLAKAPGVVILVVGPSGAGKDSVMRRARERLGPGSPIRFARRVITRPAEASEDHEAVTAAAFAVAAKRGDFVLAWQAHGLRYGIPHAAFDGLSTDGVVVVNGSRAAVAVARQAFDMVRVVLITAPPAVLAARIQARGRDTDMPQRLAREPVRADELRPDAIIDNAGPLDAAVTAFLAFLSGASGEASASVRSGVERR